MSKQKRRPNAQKLTCMIYGASGRMGHQLIDALKDSAHLQLGATVDEQEIKAFDEKHTAVLKTNEKSLIAVTQGVDVIIDFSSPKATGTLIKALAASENKTVLVGTTGIDSKQKQALFNAAKKGHHKLLLAGNTSLGVATMAKLTRLAVGSLFPAGFDIEITETHHKMKADAPSGTALFIAKVLQKTEPKLKIIFDRKGKRTENTVCIHAIRGGGVVGEHSIRFISDSEEIEISHRAFNRTLFAKGAIHLACEINKNLKQGIAIELSDYLEK